MKSFLLTVSLGGAGFFSFLMESFETDVDGFFSFLSEEESAVDLEKIPLLLKFFFVGTGAGVGPVASVLNRFELPVSVLILCKAFRKCARVEAPAVAIFDPNLHILDFILLLLYRVNMEYLNFMLQISFLKLQLAKRRIVC